MPAQLQFHLISILLAGGIVLAVADQKAWLSIVFTLGFAHYLMSIIYAGKQFRQLLTQPQVVMPLLWIVLIGATLYFVEFPLALYFALHHAFNTVYIVNRTRSIDGKFGDGLRGAGVWLHLFVYMVLLRTEVPFRLLPEELLFFGAGLGYAVFFFYLHRLRSRLNTRDLIEVSGLEILALGLIAVSFFVEFSFLQIVLYHFIFWALFPASRIALAGSGPLFRYAALTVACVCLFMLLSPIGVWDYRLIGSAFHEQFILWSHIHITSSLVLSNAHPQWMVNLFRPLREPPALQARSAD